MNDTGERETLTSDLKQKPSARRNEGQRCMVQRNATMSEKKDTHGLRTTLAYTHGLRTSLAFGAGWAYTRPNIYKKRMKLQKSQ